MATLNGFPHFSIAKKYNFHVPDNLIVEQAEQVENTFSCVQSIMHLYHIWKCIIYGQFEVSPNFMWAHNHVHLINDE